MLDAGLLGVRRRGRHRGGLWPGAAARSRMPSWNSGSIEGAVNRIKKIKRQLYGRAGFELLRKMILLQWPFATVLLCRSSARSRSEFGRPDPDRVLTRWQPQLRL
ncbi:hypothetical protein GCM10018966_068260 [Streptomyces yanii]